MLIIYVDGLFIKIIFSDYKFLKLNNFIEVNQCNFNLIFVLKFSILMDREFIYYFYFFEVDIYLFLNVIFFYIF